MLNGLKEIILAGVLVGIVTFTIYGIATIVILIGRLFGVDLDMGLLSKFEKFLYSYFLPTMFLIIATTTLVQFFFGKD